MATTDELVERGMRVVRRILDQQQADLEKALLPVCEGYGFGAVMQTAAALWKERDPVGALRVCECDSELHARSCPAYYPGGEYTGERCTCKEKRDA